MWGPFSTLSLAGSPYTDLYPSVWSLWATESWWGTWKNIWFSYPNGQPWSPSTLIWGTLLIPFKPFISIASLYNFSLLINRALTCISFYMAGRSHKDTHGTGLLWMVILAMNPMIHGFAVEGIFEGTQLWPLGFWIWSMKRACPRWSIVFGCLIILSNWYWSILWILYQLIVRPNNTKVWTWTFTSILLCSPWIIHFIGINDKSISLSADIYRAMGFQFGIPTPNFQSPPNPFAQSNYIGWILIVSTIYQCRKKANLQAIMLILCGFSISIGFDWMQSIPIIGSMRFPYRMSLLILIGIAMILSDLTNRQHSRLAVIILFEFTLLSPIDQFIPSSSAAYPSYTSLIDGPVLELPGVLNRQPGTIDPSRPRMKRLMYYQTAHQQPSPWELPFNGLNQTKNCFAGTRIIDPQATESEKEAQLAIECWQSIDWVVLHNNGQGLNRWLKELGLKPIKSGNASLQLWHR